LWQMVIDELIELPRRVVHQPTPGLHQGGDCGACVLAGLMGISIEEVYDKLHPKKKPYSFSHYDMIEGLREAKYGQKKILRYIERAPSWPSIELMRQFGDTAWMQSLEWNQYITMAFEAGYYAIASVRHDKTGPFSGGTDHWVLLCGTRTRWEEDTKFGGRTGHREILVSCSSRSTPDEEWVEVGEFLKQRGGFNALLAKPV